MFVYLSVSARRAHRLAWGDTYFAEGLARAIRDIPDCDADLIYRGEHPSATQQPAVVLRIVGPHLEEPAPGLPNLLWMISPPNLAPTAMLRRYQIIFCGGQILADGLQALGLNARYLPQATDTALFHPARRPADMPEIPLVFVGGYATRADRRLVLEAVRAGFQPKIWGPGWQGVIPDALWAGERLNQDDLATTYASARIVLNSHMANMSSYGFMSNRSYDAIAAGACVVSDVVQGFSAPDLPEIRQVGTEALLRQALEAILAAPQPSRAARLAQNARLARDHSFAARAQVIVTAARDLLARGQVAPAAFRARRHGAAVMPPRLTDPLVSAPTSQQAMLQAAREILSICAYLENSDAPPLCPPERAGATGVIHALMADLREVQSIATLPAASRNTARLEALATRARRIHEALLPEISPLALRVTDRNGDSLLERVLRNDPLWTLTPEGFQRDTGKINLSLRPRQQASDLAQPVGVFIHLFHDDLAAVCARRLADMPWPMAIYASTDSAEKAARIRDVLPDAEVRVLENRGRDIWPKLYGFGDVYHRHQIVLHLHGKRSLHSGSLDEWLTHILDCILGSPAVVNRILSLFTAIPRLGMVTPATYRTVLDAAHWGANREIARELASRMNLSVPLPDDRALRFPVGSMFWARTSAIRPLLDLNLQSRNFPPEAGQLDGTLAHAIERMLGVTCKSGGYHILPVVGAGMRVHRRYQMHFGTNREVRDALEAGAFDD